MEVLNYLIFNGRCEEALEFYRRALGAEVITLMRFKDAPPCDQPGMTPPPPDKVMHAAFRVGQTTLMASDGECSEESAFKNFGLSISLPKVADVERLFAALGDGGEVQMPLTETFFSPKFGMVADRFGVTWMILADQPARKG